MSPKAATGKKTIYMVRHGQYDQESLTPDKLEGGLNELGREQAERTAARFRGLPISALVSSTLRRAVETAEIIGAGLPGVKLKKSHFLVECIPCVPPAYADYFAKYPPAEIARGERQAAEAFEKFFGLPKRGEKQEIIVCHGNIIRYFVCRILGVAPEVWASMDIYNCGITEILLDADGTMRLVSHNEAGHLPPEMRTFL